MMALLRATVFSLALQGGAPSQGPAPGGGKEHCPPKSQPQQGQQAPAADKRGTEQAPLVVKTIPAPKTHEESARDSAEQEKHTAAEWRTVVFTGLVAAFTLLLVVATGVLARVGMLQRRAFVDQAARLRETVEITRGMADTQARDMQQAIRVAELAAKAAVDANDLTRETLVNTQRPWIKVDVTIDDNLIFGEDFAQAYVTFVVENVGRSPANHVRCYARLIAMGPQTAPAIELKRMATAAREATNPLEYIWGLTLFPNETDTSNVRVRLEKAEIDVGLLATGQAADFVNLALVGLVEYQFSMSTDRHQTAFTYYVARDDDKPIRPSDHVAMNVSLQPIAYGHYAD